MKRITDYIIKYEEAILHFGVVGIVVLLLLGTIALAFGYGDKGERTLAYDESASAVNYNVYLKPNNTYDGSYIVGSTNRSYPTSLIDYLDIDYNYAVTFEDDVEGDISYRLVSLTSADKVDGATTANLWSEEHNIIASQTMHVSGREFAIAQNTKATYDVYTDILDNFEKEAHGVIAKGTLNVALVITGQLKTASFADPANFNARLDFTIPIATNSSVEATTNTVSQNQSLREIPTHLNLSHLLIVILGFILVIAGLILAAVYAIARHHKISAHPYEENVKKLLSAYDGIIVELSHAPAFKGTAVSDVEEFDELLDVYNSVHLPINYYKSRRASYFVIIGEKNAWRYILSEDDFKRNVKKK